MSAAEHTKGPLMVHWNKGDGDFHHLVPANQQHELIAKVNAYAPTDGDMETEGKANALRLAVCWNALSALTTEQIKGGVVQELLAALDDVRDSLEYVNTAHPEATGFGVRRNLSQRITSILAQWGKK